MPPVGFKRSRALWDNARRPHAHWSRAIRPWCRAIMYELQPIRSTQLPDTTNMWRRMTVALQRTARHSIPRALRAAATLVTQRTTRQWMWVAAALVYYVVVRWLHEALDAGPIVLIATMLVGIFTIGLGDDGNADGISAYSVFNRGFQRLLGTVEAEDLVAQQMGGGMMRLHDRQEGRAGGDILVEPQPPPRRARAAAANNNNNNELDNNNQPNDADEDNENDNNNNNNNNNNNINNQPRRRLPGKKARRRNVEQRREQQRQREAALAMGFNADEQDEAFALQRLLEEQVAENQDGNN